MTIDCVCPLPAGVGVSNMPTGVLVGLSVTLVSGWETKGCGEVAML